MDSFFKAFKFSFNLIIFMLTGLMTFFACNLNEGKRTYELTCGNCHMDGGQGLVKLIPGFKESSFQSDREKMICSIIKGVNDSIKGDFMPSYEFMNDAQISNILNYIQRLKKFKASAFTDKEVVVAREHCQ
ncbi:MAG: cytochrome c [Saprospiraceae bacterium]